MEDAELVLKELRIDWETVLTEEYNPLKQALEIKRNSLKLSNYRNIYHKVERIMEKIIEETYKGFSDSVLSYTECYNLTTKGLKDLNQMQKIIDNTASMKINTKDIYGNYQETEYLRIKNEICEDLVNLKEKYESFKSFYKENKIQQAVHDLQEVRDLIKIKNLYNIKGIDTFGLEVEGDVKEVCEEIFSKLDLFIYKNEIEFKDYFRLIIVLNRILKYDRFVYANLEKNVFRSIEGIIHGINKKGGECSEGDDGNECSEGEDGSEYSKDSDGDDGSKDSDVDMDDKCIDNNVDNNQTNVHNIHNSNTHLPLVTNGTKIIFTLKSQNKITCFYSGKLKFKSNRNLKSLLVKLIVDKIKMIKYNLNFLRQMTDNAFSQLNEEEKNYYAEYKGFMIFCDKGKENTNLIIQKVINTFIDVYTSSDKKDIEIGEFENINILDDINYEEEFDEKYSIYKRIQNKNEGNEGKIDNFTLIFKPNIDICLDLYEFFKDEPIKQRCLKFIDFRSEEVYKRVILIFQEHKWDRNNFLNSNLWFTNSFLKILKEEEGILRVFGAISLKKSFEIVKRKMKEKFDFYFNSEIFRFFLKKILNEIIIFTDKKDLNLIDWSNQEKQTSNTQFIINLKNLKGLETTDIFKFSNFVKIEQKSNFKFFIKFSEEVKTELKTYVISNFINNKELLNSKSKYDHILFSINSLIELSLIEMAYQYAFSLKINLFLEIFFYLDVWYREGIYDNLVYIMKIIKIIQETYKNLDLSDLFEIINFYLIKNKKRINVKNKKDLESFVKGIKILDECLSDVNEKKNLKKSIEYYCCEGW